jgi:hypothetical protein
MGNSGEKLTCPFCGKEAPLGDMELHMGLKTGARHAAWRAGHGLPRRLTMPQVHKYRKMIRVEILRDKGMFEGGKRGMAEGRLIIELGKFTGQRGLQVSGRLRSEAESQWDKLENTPLPKPPNLRSLKAVIEDIVVRCVDKCLSEIPAKDTLERDVGQPISDAQWKSVVDVDGAFSLEELRQICREKGLKHTGDKKALAGRILRYWP